jgi:hypothetical protein
MGMYKRENEVFYCGHYIVNLLLASRTVVILKSHSGCCCEKIRMSEEDVWLHASR